MAASLKHSLRRRLAVNLALFCILFVGALAFGIYVVANQQENTLIDRILQDRMSVLMRDLAAAGPAGYAPKPGGSDYVARGDAGMDRIPAYLRALAPGSHAVWTGERLNHVVVRDAGGARLYAMYDATNHERRMKAFAWTLLGALTAAAAAAAALGYWWSRSLILQVAELARRVDKLRPGARDDTIARDVDEDLARLAVAFDNFQASTMQAVEREREFAANVSHEMRTPLTLIRTSCELLAEDPALQERQRALIARIAAATEHMSESMRSFLLLARDGDLGDSDLVPLKECVLEVLEPLRSDIERKAIALEVQVAADAAVLANREAVFIVVANLLKNAVKYTDSGRIAVHCLGEQFSVEDTGCGIPPSDIPNVFLPFYRARSAGESAREGLGLGLAIVKRISDHYGWAVAVESAAGRGTVARVHFSRPAHLFE